MEENKFRFSQLVIAHCVVNMFSSAWVIGQYVDEHTIKTVGEEALFDKCDKMYAFSTSNDATVALIKIQDDNLDEHALQEFIDRMHSENIESATFVNC